MTDRTEIAAGMPVFGSDERPLGVVEAVGDDALTVGTLEIPRQAVGEVRDGAVYLRLAAAAVAASPDIPPLAAADTTASGVEQIVVPVVEERLAVGTRTVDLGEVEIRKRVVEETVMQPVTVRREVVEVVHRDATGTEIDAQPITPAAPGQHQP
jgi:uncharacterized protein (TIGR02271 family)